MSRGKKKKEELYWSAASKEATNTLKQPTPLETAYSQSQMDFLNWDKSAGKDVRNAPGLDSYIQIGQAAQDRANQQRHGVGGLALADNGSSGYADKLRQEGQLAQGERFGTGLENALAARRSEATGSVMPLASLDLNRKNAVADSSRSMFGLYLNRPKSTPFWQQLALQGSGAALSALV